MAVFRSSQWGLKKFNRFWTTDKLWFGRDNGSMYHVVGLRHFRAVKQRATSSHGLNDPLICIMQMVDRAIIQRDKRVYRQNRRRFTSDRRLQLLHAAPSTWRNFTAVWKESPFIPLFRLHCVPLPFSVVITILVPFSFILTLHGSYVEICGLRVNRVIIG